MSKKIVITTTHNINVYVKGLWAFPIFTSGSIWQKTIFMVICEAVGLLFKVQCRYQGWWHHTSDVSPRGMESMWNSADVKHLQSARKGDWPRCLLWSGGGAWVRVESPPFTKAETTEAVLLTCPRCGAQVEKEGWALRDVSYPKTVRLLSKHETNSKDLQHPRPPRKVSFWLAVSSNGTEIPSYQFHEDSKHLLSFT